MSKAFDMNTVRLWTKTPAPVLGMVIATLGLIGCSNSTESPRDDAAAVATVSSVLDTLHDAAAQADFDRYFGVFVDDGVFLGTDATERWTVTEFKDYTRARFESGGGWAYTMNERHITIGPNGSVAWFDESLYNENLGVTRGSGVLVREAGSWKIAQYNLTIPVPNDLARQVVRMIRENEAAGMSEG